MPIPLIAAAASAILGGYLNKRGTDKAAHAAGTASKNAENARQDSMAALSDPSIYGASDWLFPDLLPNPAPKADPPTQGGPSFAGGIPRGSDTYIPPNRRLEEGGPAETGADHVVGEGGPELFIPDQDGTVIPNEQSGLGPGPIPEGGGMGMDPMQGMGGMEGMPGGGGPDPQLVQAIVEIVMQVLQGGGGAPDAAMGAGTPPMGGGGEMGMAGPPGPEMGGGMGGPEMGGIPGMAEGGPVQAGKPYVVGETGARPGQPQGIQGGATPVPSGQPTPGLLTPTNYDYAGEAGVNRTLGLLNNPGQLSSAEYERQQEQANVGQNASSQAITGGLAQGGVDPNSALGGSLQQSATQGANKQRSEAARDYDLAQEQLGRADVAQGMQQQLAMLQTIFGLQTARAGAAAGTGFPQVQPINPYAGLATGVATAGQGLADYFADRDSAGDQGSRYGEGVFDDPEIGAGETSPN